MIGFRRSLLILLFILVGAFASAQTARDTTVEVAASVQLSPPQIALNWLPTTFPVTLQKVYRKPKGAGAWTDIATLSNSATSFLDTAVEVAVSYEYFVVRLFSSTDPGSASGYVNAGIRLPLQTSRGRVLLLVDNSVAAGLSVELLAFVRDLLGDGWSVVRQDVPRMGSPSHTRSGTPRSLCRWCTWSSRIPCSADDRSTRCRWLAGHRESTRRSLCRHHRPVQFQS